MIPAQLQSRPIIVLYAEDDENDVELTRIGLRQAHLSVDLKHVNNGEECLAFLRKEGIYRDMPDVDLLFLDINMPRKNGFEVLKEIAADPMLCSLPVVVLTTSKADEDIVAMYKLRCSSYITKPVNFEKFASVIRSMTDYWFTIVTLPLAAARKFNEDNSR
jgi:CheY-like chemotaxis protein